MAALLAAASMPQCTASNSVRTTVEELARAPDGWFDRCVRLDGYVSWYYFYTDAAGRYRHRATDKDDRQNEGWLGLYFRDQEETKKPFGKASVFGRVDNCERSYKAAQAKTGPDAIIMSLGYCHYEGGLTLKEVTVSARSEAKFDRAHGEEARRKFGDLDLPNESMAVPRVARELVEQFRAAFALKDTVLLTKLVEPYDVTLDDNPDKERQFSDLLSGMAGPLSTFRQAGKLPEPAWYFAKLPKDADDEPDWYSCFCRTGDCSGEWPISQLDVYLSDDLPYVCLQTYEDNSGSDQLRLGLSVAALIEDSAD